MKLTKSTCKIAENLESIRNEQWRRQKPPGITPTWPSCLSVTGKQTWFCLKLCHRTQPPEKKKRVHNLFRCSLSSPWKYNYFITMLLSTGTTCILGILRLSSGPLMQTPIFNDLLLLYQMPILRWIYQVSPQVSCWNLGMHTCQWRHFEACIKIYGLFLLPLQDCSEQQYKE